MKPPLSSYSEEPSNGSQDVILRKLSRGDRHDDEEEVFSMNEIPFSKVEKVRRHSTIHRTKSQWENFVESVDVSKSIHSGVFKLTLHQVTFEFSLKRDMLNILFRMRSILFKVKLLFFFWLKACSYYTQMICKKSWIKKTICEL